MIFFITNAVYSFSLICHPQNKNTSYSGTGSIFHCIEFLNFSIIHNYYKYHLLIHYYVVIG